MSLVNNACRNDARSAPDTTIRPRATVRSTKAARWRAAAYAEAEAAGIMVLCWGDAPIPFYPCGGSRVVAGRVDSIRAGSTGDRAWRDDPDDVRAWRADRKRAGQRHA